MKKFLVTILLMSVMLIGHGQPKDGKLVADETWYVAGKTGFRIVTSNDSIAHKLRSKFENNGIYKFTYMQKKDRAGVYWERSFYFKEEHYNIVVLFINNGFK